MERITSKNSMDHGRVQESSQAQIPGRRTRNHWTPSSTWFSCEYNFPPSMLHEKYDQRGDPKTPEPTKSPNSFDKRSMCNKIQILQQERKAVTNGLLKGMWKSRSSTTYVRAPWTLHPRSGAGRREMAAVSAPNGEKDLGKCIAFSSPLGDRSGATRNGRNFVSRLR